MKLIANLLSTSIDMRTTATYEVTFISEAPFEGEGAAFIDVHSNGTCDRHNLKSGTASAITKELVRRYVLANGWWPKHHEFKWEQR